MKNLFKNILIFTMFVLIILTFLIIIYKTPLLPYDELWNFQNIYKMYNNSIIYLDNNVIITPIFYFLSLIFFLVFGASIISFRFLNIAIYTMYFFILYKIFSTLKVSKPLTILFLTFSFMQIYTVTPTGANYNILSVVFVLLGIYIYLNSKKQTYINILQGIIIFLVFFTKQNIGIYYALGIFAFEFINKKDLKSFLLNQITKMIIFFILLFMSLFYFYIKGNLIHFINYTFGGLFSFGKSNITFSVSLNILVFFIIILLFYFYIVINKKILNNSNISYEQKKNFIFLGCIAIPMTLSVYPILNNAHFKYIMPLYALLLFYFLDFTILEDIFNSQKKDILTIFCYCTSILILSFILYNLYSEFNCDMTKISDSNSPFYNIPVTSETYEKIDVMTNYIKEKNKSNKQVIIISSDSAFTMVTLNQNNNAFDLVFNGNLGYNGENKLISEIQNSKNTEFLIYTNESDCFWQESKIVRNFIINNLNKTGEILNYSIYELKN